MVVNTRFSLPLTLPGTCMEVARRFIAIIHYMRWLAEAFQEQIERAAMCN